MVPSVTAAARRYKELSIPTNIMAGTADQISDPLPAVRPFA